MFIYMCVFTYTCVYVCTYIYSDGEADVFQANENSHTLLADETVNW